LRLIQIAVGFLMAVGLVSTVLIGLAINDIYNKLDNTTKRLCAVEIKQQEALNELGGRVHPPFTVPALPQLPHPCSAKPGEGK
jgi:hypothetical protein